MELVKSTVIEKQTDLSCFMIGLFAGVASQKS